MLQLAALKMNGCQRALGNLMLIWIPSRLLVKTVYIYIYLVYEKDQTDFMWFEENVHLYSKRKDILLYIELGP